jgi:acetoin:2,6-dichlorophenolindophenol oxidoreductase subunit alpha
MTTTVRKKRGRVPSAAPTGASAASNPLISDAKLKQIYSTMLQCRLLNERASRLTKSSGLFLGGEAIAVGAGIDLRRDDWVATFEKELLGQFIKGVPLASIFSSLNSGKPATKTASKPPAAAPLKEDSSPSHILSGAANPAAQLNLASGLAIALQAKKTGNVVMAFCGDSSGVGQRWQEALAFAGEHCLPLLIVVQSTVSSRPTSLSQGKPFPSLISKEHACEVPVIPVDADDVVAIYRVAYESIHKARHGGGPTLIQAVSFRGPAKRNAVKAHSSDQPDAFARMEAYLTAKGLFSASWQQKLVDDFNRNLDSLVRPDRRSSLRNR